MTELSVERGLGSLEVRLTFLKEEYAAETERNRRLRELCAGMAQERKSRIRTLREGMERGGRDGDFVVLPDWETRLDDLKMSAEREGRRYARGLEATERAGSETRLLTVEEQVRSMQLMVEMKKKQVSLLRLEVENS